LPYFYGNFRDDAIYVSDFQPICALKG